MKDNFHGLEQIQGHFVFTCPIHDVNHLTWMPPAKTAGLFHRKVNVGVREYCTEFWSSSHKDRRQTTTDVVMMIIAPPEWPANNTSYCMFTTVGVILWMMLATGILKPETMWWTGYPGPEPDRYPVPKVPESPSTTSQSADRRGRWGAGDARGSYSCVPRYAPSYLPPSLAEQQRLEAGQCCRQSFSMNVVVVDLVPPPLCWQLL